MENLNNLELEDQVKQHLPLLYNHIYFNELHDADAYFTPVFSERYGSYIDFSKPGKLISKIIDLSKIHE